MATAELFFIRRMVMVDGCSEREYLASQGGVWTRRMVDADPHTRREADATVQHWRDMNRKQFGEDCINTSIVPMPVRH